MPVFLPTEFTARVTFLGRVPPVEGQGLASVAQEALDLGFAVEGEVHGGMTRGSCSRVLNIHPDRGTEIRNTRQLSILSAEEMAQIAANMELESLDPALLGASIVLEGIPDFSFVPPGSRLVAEGGAVITIDVMNRPCVFPGKVIETVHPGFGPRFKPAAKDLRGVTAWVERPGTLRLGDALLLFIPNQRGWAHFDAARAGEDA